MGAKILVHDEAQLGLPRPDARFRALGLRLDGDALAFEVAHELRGAFGTLHRQHDRRLPHPAVEHKEEQGKAERTADGQDKGGEE